MDTTISPHVNRRSWPFTKPAIASPRSLTRHPPFGQPTYAKLVFPVTTIIPLFERRTFNSVKKEIDALHFAVQLERIAVEEFLKEMVPHFEQRYDPRNQTTLDQLFVRFASYRETCIAHLERVIEFVHLDRRLCAEHREILKTPTVHLWSVPPRELCDLAELQVKLEKAMEEIGNRLMWLAGRGGRNPRWRRGTPADAQSSLAEPDEAAATEE
jgi:hypothetical protein